MKKNKTVIILAVVFGAILFISGCSLLSNEPSSVSTNVPEKSEEPIITEDQENFKTGTSVDLNSRDLNDLDMSIFENKELETLNISNNNLSGALPSQIGNLENLKVLNASNNNFTGIPAEIGYLIQLEEIDFSNNNLTGLPLELGDLTNLKKFNISGNRFSEDDLNIIRESLPNTEFITN
jgi:Leucine-rich repeat (LRR) protein